MLDQLLAMFGQSPQGQQAYSQLQAQGYTPQQSAGILTTAFPAAAQALHGFVSGQGGANGPSLGLFDIKDGHYATNFLSAAVTGLLKGEGLKGAAIDGAEGIVGGQVAEVIASRCGLPQRIAGVLGAIITPPMITFLWDKVHTMNLGGMFGGGAQAPGLAPGMAPGMAPAAQPNPAAASFGSSFSPFGR